MIGRVCHLPGQMQIAHPSAMLPKTGLQHDARGNPMIFRSLCPLISATGSLNIELEASAR